MAWNDTRLSDHIFCIFVKPEKINHHAESTLATKITSKAVTSANPADEASADTLCCP
jgi:hypothetical protein